MVMNLSFEVNREYGTVRMATGSGADAADREFSDAPTAGRQGDGRDRHRSTALFGCVDVKTSGHYNGVMSELKRATVYLDPGLHQALRVKATHTDHTISELVNATVRRSLAEDAKDLATIEARAEEPALSFEEVLKDMKRRGNL